MPDVHKTVSFWQDTVDMPMFTPLSAPIAVDACVIGGGIAGLTTAFLLLQAGRSVALVEANVLGGGETGNTTAHFFPPDERYFRIEEKFGRDGARIVADAYSKATSLVESIVESEGMDCNFFRLDGYLVTHGRGDPVDIDREYEAARRAGVEVEILARVPELPYDTGRCLRFANNAQFHPLKYLCGLAMAIDRMGGKIYCGTRATAIEHSGDRKLVRTADGFEVQAEDVIVATHTPFNDRTVMHTKQSGYMSYVIGARVKRDEVPAILMWDTGDPYHYVRLAATDNTDGSDLLIIGGEDHKTGQDPQPRHRFDALENWMRERFPMAQEVSYRWSGMVMEPADGLAFFGRNPLDERGIYIITGDSGNGMTHCTAGAILVRDLVCGISNPWADLFAPNRKAVHGLGDYLREQGNVVRQYADWVKDGEVEHPSLIPAGEGALVRQGMKLLAVHRSADGRLSTLSAACTHLGCAVHWNGVEKSWDCPCHASRFSPDGEVLHGPATKPLAREQLDPD
jgi:glycine/D-amino acid oxidase-like deaminating enzyme/nitrite reductase/ring-hydroxylating ferredoxin subunit